MIVDVCRVSAIIPGGQACMYNLVRSFFVWRCDRGPGRFLVGFTSHLARRSRGREQSHLSSASVIVVIPVLFAHVELGLAPHEAARRTCRGFRRDQNIFTEHTAIGLNPARGTIAGLPCRGRWRVFWAVPLPNVKPNVYECVSVGIEGT